MAQPGARGVDVRIDEAQLTAFVHGAGGELAKLMAHLGERSAQLAKRNAPVGDRNSKTPQGHPSGWLRSQIGWEINGTQDGWVVDVVSPAVTSPASVIPGDPYAYWIEHPEKRPHHGGPAWLYAKDGPYLAPAIMEAMREVFSDVTGSL